MLVDIFFFMQAKPAFCRKWLRFFIYSKTTNRHKCYGFHLKIRALDMAKLKYSKHIGPPLD